jgi:acyl-CoA thioester hydrolase
MLETYRGAVYPDQLDHMGHMNVQYYTAKFDEATWQFFCAIGITPGHIRENNRGMAGLEQTTKYKAEVMAGDLLHITSEVIEVKDKTIRFLHTMYNSETGNLVATSELVAAHLDRDKRKACSFPESVAKKCIPLTHRTP